MVEWREKEMGRRVQKRSVGECEQVSGGNGKLMAARMLPLMPPTNTDTHH